MSALFAAVNVDVEEVYHQTVPVVLFIVALCVVFGVWEWWSKGKRGR